MYDNKYYMCFGDLGIKIPDEMIILYPAIETRLFDWMIVLQTE